MKRLFQLLLFSGAVILTVLSCKDDFNEQDFLKLQSDLKLKQDSISRRRNKAASDTLTANAIKEYVAAANAAGDLMAVTLLVRENGNPLPGVAVTMNISTKGTISNGRESSTQAVTTGTTDANGSVTFDKVVIGAGNIMFAKSGYISSTAMVDFGTPAKPREISVQTPNGTVTKYVAPEKIFRDATIRMYSASATEGSTATIKGKVTIQNDVTNLTAEVPSNVIIRANLAKLSTSNTVNAGNFIQSYSLADNSSLGVATVSPSGDFTMTVPAYSGASSPDIDLIIPNVEGTCRMAVNGYDDGTGTAVKLANGPAYRDVPTSWGPQAPVGFGDAIPAVVGVRAVFPAPPAPGTGFNMDFTEVPRGLPLVQFSSEVKTSAGFLTGRITDRGQYSNGPAPTVTVTGGGGTGAEVKATIRTYISGINVINQGSGYASDLFINLVRVAGDGQETIEASVAVTPINGKLPATADLFDKIYAHPNNNLDGFVQSLPLEIVSTDVNSLKITITKTQGDPGTGAQITGTFKTEVSKVIVTKNGSGYVSKPTFTFTGGGLSDTDSKQADFEVIDFGVQWTMTPNQSASTDYPVMPQSVLLLYPVTPANNANFRSTDVDILSISGLEEQLGANLNNELILSSKRIVFKGIRKYITSKFSSVKPTLLVVPNTTEMAAAGISADEIVDGQFKGFKNNSFNAGKGYDRPFVPEIQPAIVGASGSGAQVAIEMTYDPVTFGYSWANNFPYGILNPGSGYLKNLNRQDKSTPPFPLTVSAVQPGKTYTVNIDYGTGNRKVAVN